MSFEFTTNMAVLQNESDPVAYRRRTGDKLELEPSEASQSNEAGLLHLAFLDREGNEQFAVIRTSAHLNPAPEAQAEVQHAISKLCETLGLRLLTMQLTVERSYMMLGERPKVGLTLIRGGLLDVDIRL